MAHPVLDTQIRSFCSTMPAPPLCLRPILPMSGSNNEINSFGVLSFGHLVRGHSL